MEKPVCSIIIPSRNCLNYLSTTLASVALQDCGPLEVILADDGSTDGTAEWCGRQSIWAGKLRIIQTGGVGPSAARNKAIDVASSDLLAFLDADDFWWPNKLGRQLAFHRANPDVALTFTDYIHMGPDNRTYGTCFEYAPCTWTKTGNADYTRIVEPEACLLANNLVGTSTVVARRPTFESVGGFPNRMQSAEDWDLWLRMAAKGSVAFSNAVTLSYLMRPGSVTANRPARIEAMRSIVDRYRQRPEPFMQAAVRAADARIAIAVAEAARERGDFQDAAISHLRALAAMPTTRVARAAASDMMAAGMAKLQKVCARA